MSKALGLSRRFGEHAGASPHAEPFPEYVVSPKGRERVEARKKTLVAPSKGHQDGCVQEDGSIIMQPGYINTAKNGENCQKQQIAEFVASVQQKSPGKLRIPGLEAPARRRRSSSAAVSPGPRSGERRLEDAGGRKHAVLDAREARDVPCGADSASSTRHENQETSSDHARYSQSSAGASQHLLEDEMSQAETTVRTAEPSRSRMWSEAVPGDETAGESEGEAFFDDVITCQIAGLADDDLDEAGEFDDIPDVPVLEPELLKPVTSRTGTHGVQAPADAQKTAGALRSAQAAAGSSKGGNHWQFSPAAARAQEECLGTSQAMLDAQFALEYGAGLRE
jgi:hypothetical protein